MNWDDVVPTEGDGQGVAHFTASYASECVTCWNTIEEGDKAGYLPGDDQASCGECCGLS